MDKVLIIAEAGVNHNGDIQLAKEMIDVAVEAKVDIVKFQTFIAKNLVAVSAPKADYQKNNTGNDDSQLSMLEKLELTREDHLHLIEYCRTKNIRFLSTAFDMESLDLLIEIGIDLFKIPSGEITNLPFLKRIGALKKEVIISTGMSTMAEIGEAINVIIGEGTALADITVLHCNTDYPTAFCDVNLKAMKTIQDAFGVQIGYSDHTLGIEVPIAAVALGAKVIEKHFTLNKKFEGPDHIASLDGQELKAMVSAIRSIETALGSSEKVPTVSESKNIGIARKSIYLGRSILKGEKIRAVDLIMKRPGNGISPMKMNEIVGKTARKDLFVGAAIEWGDIE